MTILLTFFSSGIIFFYYHFTWFTLCRNVASRPGDTAATSASRDRVGVSKKPNDSGPSSGAQCRPFVHCKTVEISARRFARAPALPSSGVRELVAARCSGSLASSSPYPGGPIANREICCLCDSCSSPVFFSPFSLFIISVRQGTWSYVG